MNSEAVNQNPLLFSTLWFSFLLIGSPTYIRYKQVLKYVFSTFISNTIVTSDSPAKTHYIVAVRSINGFLGMWQEEWRYEEGNDYLGLEKTWGVMFMFSIFIVLVVSWVYTYAITSNILNT